VSCVCLFRRCAWPPAAHQSWQTETLLPLLCRDDDEADAAGGSGGGSDSDDDDGSNNDNNNNNNNEDDDNDDSGINNQVFVFSFAYAYT